MLHEFIRANRSEILRRTQARVAIRPAPPSRGQEERSGIPLFLDELVEMLRDPARSNAVMDDNATRHGKSRFSAGFTVTQVVQDYGDVCQVVTELAIERNATVTTEEFRSLNLCLDEAIAGAVTEHGRATRAADSELESEQAEALTREMQRHLDVACLAFQIIQKGTVSVGGRTGSVLGRSLSALQDLLRGKSAGLAVDERSAD
jgi:hypothetical protein